MYIAGAEQILRWYEGAFSPAKPLRKERASTKPGARRYVRIASSEGGIAKDGYEDYAGEDEHQLLQNG